MTTTTTQEATMKDDNGTTPPSSPYLPSSLLSASSSPIPTLSRSSSSSESESTASNLPSDDDAITIPSLTNYYRNNPNNVAPIHVDTNAPISLRNSQILKAVTTICPDFSSSQEISKVKVEELGGGLSNHLFVVSSSSTSSSLLIRIHPESSSSSSSLQEDTLINREAENKIMAILSSQGIAPLYHGRFINGRIEEFLENVRPLRHDEILSDKFGREVARAMGELHLVTSIPANNYGFDDEKEEEEGEIVGTIHKWMQMAQRVVKEKQQQDDCERVGRILSFLEEEWEWLFPTLFSSTTVHEKQEDDEVEYARKAITFLREVVFTHMDCQSLNILTPLQDNNSLTSPPKVKLIDFEYASHNRRAIDIANTFCECCDMNNLCPNYSQEYPSSSQQDAYLKTYVQKAAPQLATELDGGNDDKWSSFLNQSKKEVGKHALISHLSWSIWSIVQWGNGCDIEFDYVRYAELRVEGYRYFKECFWGC